MRTMGAGEFKAKCLAIMDEVAATGEPLLVTKRGKPVVGIVSPSLTMIEDLGAKSIFGFMRGCGAIVGDIVSPDFPAGEWDRVADQKWDRVEGENPR